MSGEDNRDVNKQDPQEEDANKGDFEEENVGD